MRRARAMSSLAGTLVAALSLAMPVATAAPVRTASTAPSIATSSPPVNTPTCGGVKLRKSTGGYWTCTFADEFSAWTATNWWAMSTSATGFSIGNECLDPANLSISSGSLIIKATKSATPFTCGGRTTSYRSAIISTSGRFTQTYGRFEMRAQFPPGVGLQPAFWMLPQTPSRPSGYYYGEIDVVESWGSSPDIASPHLHYVTTNRPDNGWYCYVPGSTTGFHTYAVEWTPSKMKFVYDGKLCWETGWKPGYPYAPVGAVSPAPFDQPFYLIVALGVDTTPENIATASTVFPASMRIDYIRGWK